MNKLSKGIRGIAAFLLTIIQIIPLAEGWISYLLGSITASLFTPLSQLSLLWYPIDVLFQWMWMGCDWLKQSLWQRPSTWKACAHRWDKLFPAF